MQRRRRFDQSLSQSPPQKRLNRIRSASLNFTNSLSLQEGESLSGLETVSRRSFAPAQEALSRQRSYRTAVIFSLLLTARSSYYMTSIEDSSTVTNLRDQRWQKMFHSLRNMLTHEQGQIRQLKYQEDSMNLYFITSLQHAVQRYSLHTAKLLEPSYAHPSPPTVFAISVLSHFLLSASASPPIIHLTNILVNESPLLIKPFASSSAVVAAAFHPSEDTIFVLGFADGTAAAYDAKHMFYDRGLGKRKTNVFDYCSAGEISHIKNLHVVTTATSCSDPDRASFFCCYDNGTKTTAVGDLAQSIMALTFVPGFACVVVTVGADGRCCVVDFGLGTSNRAEIAHAWHIRGSATSISALSMRPDFPWYQVDDLDGPSQTSAEVLTISPLVAVGRQDGTVLLFDLEGNLQEQHTFGTEDARIIDVDWLTNPDQEHKEDLLVREKRHLVSIINGRFTDPAKKRRPVYQDLPRTSGVPQQLSASSSSRVPVSLESAGPTSVQAQSSRSRADTISTLKMTTSYSEPSSLSVRNPANLSRLPSLGTSATMTGPTKESESPLKRNKSPPKIPPRPVPRKGGKLAQRRAERATMANDAPVFQAEGQERQTPDQMDGPNPPSEGAQRMSDPKPKDLVNLESGSRKGKPKMPSRPRKASARKASSTIRTSNTKASVLSPPKKRPISTQPSTAAPTEHSNDTVIDWIANYGAPESKIIRKPLPSIVHPTAPLSPLPPAHTPPLPPPSTSILPQSIASDDTVIDWHTLKPAPTRALNLLNTINHTPHDSIVVGKPTQTRSFKPYPQRPQPHAATTSSVISPRASIGSVPQPQHPTFHPQPCPCIQDNIILHRDIAELQKSVGQELRSLKEAVKATLRKEKKWVEAQMGISEEGMRALEEENRRLRGELGKLAKSNKEGNRGQGNPE